jgi:hypothetical protein
MYSLNGVPIRLTEERWQHILTNKPYMRLYHGEVLKAIDNPTWILRGYAGALVAVLSLARGNYLHVVYREINQDDGFVITAFIARRVNRRMIIWPRRS